MNNELSKINIFNGLSEVTLRILDSAIQPVTFQKGSEILSEKDVCRWVYFIQSGYVDVYLLEPNGHERVMERLGLGAGFNLVPAYKHMPNNHSNARAATDVVLLRMNKDDFSELIERLPEFSQAVADYMALRMARMVNFVQDLSQLSMRQRLASFLVNQAENDGGRWSQEEIAERLGTVREVVGMILKKFEDDGLIRFERQHIVLVDREGLQKVAVEINSADK
jgi:CRP/FNR family transcriptional regulator